MDSFDSNISFMTISLEKGVYKACDARKTSKGQYNTKGKSWLFPHVVSFIEESGAKIVVDPFAGDGDLLNTVSECICFEHKIGYDIDDRFAAKWKINDSLKRIDVVENSLIVTNPPYLAKHSAARKGVIERVEDYYKGNKRSDLYQIAIDKCIESCRYVVAIVPETIINSGIDLSKFRHISIVLEKIFIDTDQPVVVVCIDRDWIKGPDIYINEKNVGSLEDIQKFRLIPDWKYNIKFNFVGGQIGLRAVDLPSPDKKICFMPAENLGYSESGIKVSSRLVTYVGIEKKYDEKIVDICCIANKILKKIRFDSNDVILSPFKGNDKNGFRRRRLDYDLARAILERAIDSVCDNNYHQASLF